MREARTRYAEGSLDTDCQQRLAGPSDALQYDLRKSVFESFINTAPWWQSVARFEHLSDPCALPHSSR